MYRQARPCEFGDFAGLWGSHHIPGEAEEEPHDERRWNTRSGHNGVQNIASVLIVF
jgi:hypothetical protein